MKSKKQSSHLATDNKVKTMLNANFPTHSIDITGRQICLGDKVTYDFDDNTSSFTVVFENNAFRKKYPKWNKTLEKPVLEYGKMAEIMRLKVVDSNLLHAVSNKELIDVSSEDISICGSPFQDIDDCPLIKETDNCKKCFWFDGKEI